MKEKLTSDFNIEKENIVSQLKEKRTQETELDKVLIATRKDILLLEGRLIEINAIISYVENFGKNEEPQVAPEVESLDN